MVTRRTFLIQTAAASLGAAISVPAAPATAATAAPKARLNTQNTLRTAGRRLKVIRRDETTVRYAGIGDNWHLSWAADDRQLVTLCDGTDWSDKPMAVYNTRLFALSGGPQDATLEALQGYPEKLTWDFLQGSVAPYFGFGLLAVDGRIYQFLGVPKQYADGLRVVGAKLIYSPDGGRTWYNQDGSTPVVWEREPHQSRDSMLFFEEPQEAFALLSVLQMGRDYAANRDGYVYLYAPNGNTEGTMNELVMCRVPKARLVDRSAYEYFAGRRADGSATWATDINARAAVHTFPRGWVSKTWHPYAWNPSVVYNGPLGLYLMANWGMGTTPTGEWFGKPSYLGFWVAPEPWGPWTQVHEETAWTPNHDAAARAFVPQIAPKWIAADGKSFWLVWSDFQHTSELNRLLQEALRAPSQHEFTRLMMQSRSYRPYSFSTQRVDLVVG